MELNDVLEVAQKRDEEKRKAQAEKDRVNLRRYSTLLYSCHNSKCTLTPDGVNDEIEACERTASQFTNDLQLLADRDLWQQKIEGYKIADRRAELRERREENDRELMAAQSRHEAEVESCNADQRVIDQDERDEQALKVALNRSNDRIVPTVDEIDALDRGEEINRTVYIKETRKGPRGTTEIPL